MVKYSLVGCGRIAKNHIGAAQSCQNIAISSLCDVEIKQAESLAQRFGLQDAVIYTHFKEMLQKERPDLVAIATDSGSHAEIALEAINQGCNVIIEKPIALSLEDADLLIAAAQRKGIVAAVCHQNRFNPAVAVLKNAIEHQRLGKLLYGAATIRWFRPQDYYDQANWRGKWETDGGALMNQCIHDIDLLRWMLGDPVEVAAVTARQSHSIEAEDFGAALVKFANGAFGIVEGTTNVYPENLEETLCIFGTCGTVKLGGSSLNLLEEWRLADSLENIEQLKEACNQRPPDIYGYGHLPLYRDVISAMEHGRQPLVTLKEGRAAMELVLAIYNAAYQNKPIRMPLGQCATTDFKGRFESEHT